MILGDGKTQQVVAVVVAKSKQVETFKCLRLGDAASRTIGLPA